MSETIICEDCDGSGDCPECRGEDADCEVCDETGVCLNCDGNGTIIMIGVNENAS